MSAFLYCMNAFASYIAGTPRDVAQVKQTLRSTTRHEPSASSVAGVDRTFELKRLCS